MSYPVEDHIGLASKTIPLLDKPFLPGDLAKKIGEVLDAKADHV